MLSQTWVLAIFLIASPGENLTDESIRVRLLEVAEIRHQDLSGRAEKQEQMGMQSGDPSKNPQLVLTLELQGAPIAQTTKYGHLQITTAKDDLGQSIKPDGVDSMFDNPYKEFVDFDRQSMYFWEMQGDEPPLDKIKIELKLEPSNRSAKKIAQLQGQVQMLTMGGCKEIIVENLHDEAERRIEDPSLEGTGLVLRIPPAEGERDSATLMIEGDDSLLLGIELLKADGEPIEVSTLSMSDGTTTTRTLRSWEDQLPEGAKLRITVGLDRKIIDVPFQFKDIDLP